MGKTLSCLSKKSSQLWQVYFHCTKSTRCHGTVEAFAEVSFLCETSQSESTAAFLRCFEFNITIIFKESLVFLSRAKDLKCNDMIYNEKLNSTLCFCGVMGFFFEIDMFPFGIFSLCNSNLWSLEVETERNRQTGS